MFKNEEFVYLTNALKESRNRNFKSIINIENKIYKVVKKRRCNCETATTYIGPYRHGFSLTKKIYLLKIEKEFSNNECLKFLLIHYDFGNNNIGLKNASKFYFGKTVHKLNADEIMTIIMMLENSGLYNPVRNKDGVRNKLLVYKRILNKKTSR
ncbi:transglycosylase domain-containing protein [Flavobacterium sp. P4023]|uniref:Transglycosylase domain-containing protein n=2 Tax=Flavobacterium flabelliforme TaxID=2816119 RepID=A0ABS5CX58_9FLAO|nr:transglycosylase domain-containing protein [Flavobacterium flabelliforme]